MNRFSARLVVPTLVARLVFSAALLSLLLPLPVLAGLSGESSKPSAPPEIAPEDRPSFFTITYTETGQSYDYTRTADYGYDWVATDPGGSESGSVSPTDLDNTTITILADNPDGSFDSLFTVPDGMGGSITYEFYGWIDYSTNTADGTYVLPDGTQRQVSIHVPNGNLEEPVTVVIVIGAGAIAGIGCLWHALATDCAADCRAACAPNGLKSSREGWCGRCTCECWPPQPCNQDGTGNLFGASPATQQPAPACPKPTPI